MTTTQKLRSTYASSGYDSDGVQGTSFVAEPWSCAAAMEKEISSVSSPSRSSATLLTSCSINGSLLGEADQQGYDVEFDPPLESKYECPICLMALRAAVQTPCGHRFCRSCIEKSIRYVALQGGGLLHSCTSGHSSNLSASVSAFRDSGQKCPVDNELLQEDQLFPDNFAKREILSLTVLCPNAGCDHKTVLRQLDDHNERCQFAVTLCPLCRESVRKSELEVHTAHQCPRRPVSCPNCIQTFIYEETKVHEQSCPLASVACEYCSMELIRDQLSSHCDTDCVKAPAACPFRDFGCREKMQRNNLAQHMQEFTQLHMRYMADYLRSLSLNGALGGPSDGGGGARGGLACKCLQERVNLHETVQQLDGRLVLQDQQLRELSISNDTQAAKLVELRRHLRSLEELLRELEAQQCRGIYVWQVEGFSAHLRSQESSQPVVIHSPSFYTGRPGYKLCLRLQLQAPSAPCCANYISLFVHTMQGEFDSQLHWPLQATIRLAILDQAEDHHHMEVMETIPELYAFQRPVLPRNPKGFGYITFMALQALQERQYVKDDCLLVRCEVSLHCDRQLQQGVLQGRGPESLL
nr:TNF receptor-associated factor 6-like isoform X1 [Paramormyrops kingsleyae]